MNGGRVDVWALIGNALARCSGILQSAFRLKVDVCLGIILNILWKDMNFKSFATM